MQNCGNITKPKTRVYNYLAGFDLFKELPQTISDDTVFWPKHFILNPKMRHFYTTPEGDLVFEKPNRAPLSWETYVNRELRTSLAQIYGMVLPKDIKIVKFVYAKVNDFTGYVTSYVEFNEEILDRIEKYAYEYPQELVPPQIEESDKLEPDDFTEAESPSPSISPILKIDEKGQYRMFQNVSDEGLLAAEKTIRDLAARMSDRIGIPFQIISDRTQKFKGKIENGTAVINLAYATLDTPIHEILGHPIIRAIKNKQSVTKRFVANFNKGFFDNQDEKIDTGKTIEHDGYTYNVYKLKKYSNVEYRAYNFQRNEQIELSEEEFKNITNYSQLYQNLLKELEYGKGKEVFDRIKRDYVRKDTKEGIIYFSKEESKWKVVQKNKGIKLFNTEQEAKEFVAEKYTLEEQQEEAIVELLGLYTAGRIDATKNLKLVSLLKQLLGRIKAFIRDLLFQKEVEIDKLPDNMTIGDLADLLAYSNNKLILPGNEVVYTTPDNQKFKTYAEASKHISDLARSVEDVDLSAVSLDIIKNNNPYNLVPDKPYYTTDSNFLVFVNSDKIKHYKDFPEYKNLEKENYYEYKFIPSKYTYEFVKVTTARVQQLVDNNPGLYIGASDELKNADLDKIGIKNFIEKNKEYEQSKEIIEEWKKVNNIQYNPEEIYSRGQEFTSVVGAYSNFDVDLMMQNLLQHIEDNEKAGGEFTISAFTKPIDKNIRHLEEGGGKIKFKIYPKSKDIKWAANTDVYSGSVWDASEKVSKGKQSELLGVSYTKYPSLNNISAVQPNLASIVDSLAHHHNELGITLTGNNFRLEYDEDIPYTTKKIIDSVNSILDQKYGKLVKPEVKKGQIEKYKVKSQEYFEGEIIETEKSFNTLKEAEDFIEKRKIFSGEKNMVIEIVKGIQPTQTNETLKEKLTDVAFRIADLYEEGDTSGIGTSYLAPFGSPEFKQKEYTSQALINTKIAKLKEVAKKYPRSLIRSEVRPIVDIGFRYEDVFQKIPSTSIKPGVEELFESNPELANAVYEALGFKKVYHGSKTKEKYSEYKIPVNKGVDSLGSFFTSDLDGALMFTPDFIDESPIAKDIKERTGKLTYKKDRSYVKEEYLKLQNPYNVDIRKWEDNSWINDFVKGDFSIYNFDEVPLEIVDKIKKILIDKGHDGIYIAKDFYVGNMESKYDQYIVFDPNKTLKQQKQQAQQLYSQYLDTIFPDSKVKDIVYHGTDAKFDKFLKEYAREDRPYFYFSFAEEANMYKESREGSYIYPVVLNVKNYAKGYTPDELDIDTVNDLIKKGYDAVAGRGWTTREEIAVFEPEQIHILGSKQDIEGFKEFVSGETTKEEAPPFYEMSAEEREERFQDFYNKNQNISEDEAREYFNRCML